MLNNDQQGLHAAMMGPRISFSNDFADTQQPIKHENCYREAPVSSDFQFSFSTNDMISADELFFKGKLLPLREENDNCATKTTLRDELLAEDNDDDYMDAAPPLTKGTSLSRWKERLGLKRSHIHHLPRKSADKINLPLERIDETTTTLSFNEAAYDACQVQALRTTFIWN